MKTTRMLALCGFACLLSVPSFAQEQQPLNKVPPSVSIGAVLTRDLSSDNDFMPGISAEFDWAVGRSERIAIEGSYHWQKDPRQGFTATIRQRGVSAAWRFDRPHGNGPFFQIALGLFNQNVKAGPSRDLSRYAYGSHWWAGPGLGIDLRLSQRTSVRVIAELMAMPSEPNRRLLNGRYRAAFVFRLPARQK